MLRLSLLSIGCLLLRSTIQVAGNTDIDTVDFVGEIEPLDSAYNVDNDVVEPDSIFIDQVNDEYTSALTDRAASLNSEASEELLFDALPSESLSAASLNTAAASVPVLDEDDARLLDIITTAIHQRLTEPPSAQSFLNHFDSALTRLKQTDEWQRYLKVKWHSAQRQAEEDMRRMTGGALRIADQVNATILTPLSSLSGIPSAVDAEVQLATLAAQSKIVLDNFQWQRLMQLNLPAVYQRLDYNRYHINSLQQQLRHQAQQLRYAQLQLQQQSKPSFHVLAKPIQLKQSDSPSAMMRMLMIVIQVLSMLLIGACAVACSKCLRNRYQHKVERFVAAGRNVAADVRFVNDMCREQQQTQAAASGASTTIGSDAQTASALAREVLVPIVPAQQPATQVQTSH